MRSRRNLTYLGATLVAVVACYVVFVTKPFAQAGGGPPGPGGPGMPGAPDMGGMPGAPGAPGAGGGAGNYQWQEIDMPKELLMTYGEFLAQEGQAPVAIPDVYLYQEDGTPKQCTRNEWYQLARVYVDAPVQIQQPLVGTPGGRLWQDVYAEAAVKHNEVNALWGRWCDALTNFTFEVGYPRIGPQLLQYDWKRKSLRNPDGTIAWRRWEATLPDQFTIVVPVVMHVKPGCQQNYGRKFYNAMKRFDNRGHGRSPFKFMTYEGSAYYPHTLYLADEAIRVWSDLWSKVQLQLRLFDPRNEEIVRAAQGSGLSPEIFTQMVHPPTIYYQPRYRLLLPGEDDRFDGSRLNLEGQEGWYYEFEFRLTREQLKAVDAARARLIVNGGPPERMMTLGGLQLSGAAATAPGAPTGGAPAPGGAGGPGAGEMGMGPPR